MVVEKLHGYFMVYLQKITGKFTSMMNMLNLHSHADKKNCVEKYFFF